MYASSWFLPGAAYSSQSTRCLRSLAKSKRHHRSRTDLQIKWARAPHISYDSTDSVRCATTTTTMISYYGESKFTCPQYHTRGTFPEL